MILAFLGNWKTWIGLLLASSFLLRFVPVIAPIFTALMATKLGRYVFYGVIIAAGALLLISFLEARAYERGYQDHKIQTNEQNQNAIKKANEAAIPVEQCYEKNGTWIQERGVCKLP